MIREFTRLSSEIKTFSYLAVKIDDMDEKRKEREAEKERLKAEYRADLEARKKFKVRTDAAMIESRIAEGLYKFSQHFEEFARLTETTDEMTARLNSRSALAEAKLDLALESRGVASVGVAAAPPDAPSGPSPTEKTLGNHAEAHSPDPEITQAPKKTFFDQEE
jgi:hypothetical protein